MIDFAQLQQAATLMSEYQRINAGLDNLGKGGRIIGMIVAMAERPPVVPANAPMPTVLVPTEGMEYPPQMVEGIKAQLAAHRDAIAKQLTDMGVTVGQ